MRSLILSALLATGFAVGASLATPSIVLAQDHNDVDPHSGHDPLVDDAPVDPHGPAAHAEGESHDAGGLHIWLLIAHIVNFALLMFIIIRFGKAPIAAFLVARRKHVAESLSEAQRLKAEAEAKYREYEEKLANLDAELIRVRTETIRTAEAERERVLAAAEEKGERMRREAKFLIEQQAKQLRIDLTREAADAAIVAAGSLIAQKTTQQDHERLATEFASSLGGAAKPAAPKPAARIEEAP